MLKSKKILCALLIAGGCLSAGQTFSELEMLLSSRWLTLSQSKSACTDFDYFPGGGLRNFYCHTSDILDYAQLQKLLGKKAFLKGPHRSEQLALEEGQAFGYYNPEFVQSLNQSVRRLLKQPQFVELARPAYERSVAPLARTFFATYHKLQSNPEYLKRESTHYLRLVEQKQLPNMYYEKYFFFMNPDFYHAEKVGGDLFSHPAFDGGWNGNVVKTATAFWLRRHIDQTDHLFYRGLAEVIRTFDLTFYNTLKKS